MMRIWLAVGLALGGCGKGVDAATCRERAHALATLLNTIDHDLPFADDVHLVVRPDLPRTSPRVKAADLIDVRAADVRVHGELVTDEADLRDRLAARRQDVDPAAPILLVIDEAAPFATVVWVTAAAHAAGLTRAAFVFGRTPASVEPPPRSWIDDDLDKLMSDEEAAGQKAVVLAEMTGKITKSCPALDRVFGSVAGEEGDDKGQILIDAIEPALIECNCMLDVPALRSVMYRVLYVAQPATLLTVTLTPDGRALALPASTPWKTASLQLRADDASVWFGGVAAPP